MYRLHVRIYQAPPPGKAMSLDEKMRLFQERADPEVLPILTHADIVNAL
jgi:hypothetical protein